MTWTKPAFALFIAGAMAATAVDPLPADAPPPKPNVKEIRPGIFQVGGVLLEKEKKQINFPVIVNMHEGLLE